MKREPADVLARLYAIKPETIARDLKQAEDRLADVSAALSRLTDIAYDQRTPEDDAQIVHLMMVQAHELCRAAHVLPEIKVFYAAFGVGNIVQMAEIVAMDQGRLADLRRQMAEIRQREGLAADEDWLYHGGPPDHRALEAEADAIGDGIVDTVLISVLRRYRLHEQAKLYEADRKQWEYLREVGSRVICGMDDGNADADAFTDRYLAKKYGDEFVRDLHHRVSLVREAVARARGHTGQS